ncbi:MAG: type II toxin-antitoxin system RelE/ParE family toxin, partial [Desulfobulbaceae bacterium]|nr:type II toxin-antitoxin system RelE/ParE family toxin [Desulfobulbaceae bacterium]
MDFLIADTFTDSLAKLTGGEQKAVKTTAFDLQMNPAQPGLSFHKLDSVKDHNFWSVRVNRDIRLIVHRTEASLLLCYVDHHDKAYLWAQRRKLETHPKTGAAQLVELRETVREVTVPKYVDDQLVHSNKRLLFSDIAEEYLLGYGVPPAWLGEVRIADEDSVLELAEHLPCEAAEALLDLAVGVVPQVPAPALPGANPFNHPDAQRRFRVVGDMAELERALNYPWAK